MKNRITIMNPVALGWFLVISIASILVGIIVGSSSGVKSGVVAMLIVWAFFGGIEGACVFFSDQSLLRNPKKTDQNNKTKIPNKPSEVVRQETN